MQSAGSSAEPPFPDAVAGVCRQFLGGQDFRQQPLGGRGWSGSPIYRVDSAAGGWVLKRFPLAATPARAAWVHRLMQQVRAGGVAAVPNVLLLPADSHKGRMTVAVDPEGCLWEMVEFKPGRPVEQPSLPQVCAGMRMLGQIHRAAAAGAEDGGLCRAHLRGPSPGQQRRVENAERLLNDPWSGWQERRRRGTPLQESCWLRLERATGLWRTARMEQALAVVAATPAAEVGLQPVLLDVWSDHILFGDEDNAAAVSGVIDYHAAGIDTPATDIARLLGSWHLGGALWQVPGAGRLVDRWGEALAAYQEIGRLAPEEIASISFFHATAVVFGIDHWFRWTLLDGASFQAPEGVVDRIDHLLQLLPEALEAILQGDNRG